MPTERAIAAQSREHGRRGPAAFDEPSQAIIRLGRRPDVARPVALRWADHPDERVPMALLEAQARRQVLGNGETAVQGRILRRAIADAARRGHLWTPLLDTLSATGQWSRPEDVPATVTPTPEVAAPRWWARATASPSVVESPPPAQEPAPYVTEADQLDRVGAWVAMCADPRGIQKLLEFNSPALWETVARRLRVWDRGFVRMLLDLRPELASVIAANPALGARTRAALGEWARTAIERGSPRACAAASAMLDAAPVAAAPAATPETLGTPTVTGRSPDALAGARRAFALLDAAERERVLATAPAPAAPELAPHVILRSGQRQAGRA
jgi:hypothetical protein